MLNSGKIQFSKVARLEVDATGVAILEIDNPPINALSQAVREAIIHVVQHVQRTEAIKALVIGCAGRTFFAGADIREFGNTPLLPLLPDVINAIENCSKPVVAYLHGTVLGGGLEIAMGCHARIAVHSSILGLPEVKLGLLPGAGGTQRLPRLIGVEAALTMMTSGDPVNAEAARAMGLIDACVEQNVLQETAVQFASEMVLGKRQMVITRNIDVTAQSKPEEFFNSFLARNAKKFSRLEAPRAIVDVVRQGINLPFEQAVSHERSHFLRLQAGDQSKALRYGFFAERQTSKVPGVTSATPRLPVNTIGIIGAGTMGAGIAINFLLAGLPVILIEREAETLERGTKTIAQTLENSSRNGRLSHQKVIEALGHLTSSIDMSALASADLVVEAAYETMSVKHSIFAALNKICAPQCILATNTSYLDVNEIAKATSRPDKVIGLHFFSPANVMKLLEIVRTAQTAPQVLATVIGLAKRIGKVPVVAGVCHGFIGNRMLAVRRRESEALILEGVSPYAVDRVMEEFGFPMGPFRMADLAGLDLGWSRETSTGATIRERLCEHDRRGQKSGAGFYDYVEGRIAKQSPFVEALIHDFAFEQERQSRSIDDEEIRSRLLFPMINEACKILEEKIALRGSDVDMVWLHGYGWPAWRGGPLYWADKIGLDTIIRRMHQLESQSGSQFKPSDLLIKLASNREALSEFALPEVYNVPIEVN
jgi:3-hydroxyacyl-CoA dehydrogenase